MLRGRGVVEGSCWRLSAGRCVSLKVANIECYRGI